MENDTGTKKNLLIIDKDDKHRLQLYSLLSDEYNVYGTNDFDDGIACVENIERKKSSFAAILINSAYDQASSDRFIGFMQKNAKYSAVPMLFIIDNGRITEYELRYLGKAVVDCISMPFDGEIIKNRINNAIVMKDSLSYYEIEKKLKALPSNIYMKDRDGKYIFATHYWHHLDHGDDPNWTIRGKTDPEIRKDKENAIKAMEADKKLMESKKSTTYTIEINEDGKQEFFEVIKCPTFDNDGKVDGIIGLINNVTEHELMKRKLAEKAVRDQLTGLYNRSFFGEYLERLQKKDSYPISIISADCDGLKMMNDTFGHTVGDDYLRMTVLLFKMVIPETGTLFRTGGDEFLIILPSTTEEQAEQLIAQMKEKEKLFNIREQQLSVSFGLSTVENGEESFEDGVKRSDSNMYKEKRRKKSRK